MLFFFFFFASFQLWSQEHEVTVLVEPRIATVDRRIALSFFLPVEDDLLTIEEPDFPSGIRLVGGPYTRPFYARVKDVPFERGVRVDYTVTADHPGRFIMPPFVFTGRFGTANSASFLVRVGISVNGTVHIPLEPFWRIEKRQPLLGETVSVHLELRNMESIETVRGVSVDNPRGALFHRYRGLGTIEAQSRHGIELYTLPVAAYLLTPLQEGVVILPSATVKTDDASGKTETVTLSVRPVPEKVRSSGAVGSFTRTLRLNSPNGGSKRAANDDDEPAAVLHTDGTIFTVTQRLEGKGNFTYLSLPEPEGKDCVLIDNDEEEEFQAAREGYVGYVEHSYTFSVEGANGPAEVVVPEFIWYDPAADTVEISEEKSFSVSFSGESEEKLSEGEKEAGVFEILPPARIKKMNGSSLYRNPLLLLFLLPGVIIVPLSIVFRKKIILLLSLGLLCFCLSADNTASVWDLVENGNNHYKEQNYREALRFFTEALRVLPKNGGIHYNASVTYHALNETAKAVFHGRAAVKYAPFRDRLRSTLRSIEDEAGLTNQIPLPVPVHPDVPAIVALVFFNGACFSLALYLLKRDPTVFMIFMGTLLLCIGSVVLFSITYKGITSEWGVVGRDAVIKKIPRVTASDWFSLPEGTVVRVQLHSEGFAFIKTGKGIEGWINQTDISLDLSSF